MFKSVNRISVLKCLTKEGFNFSPRTSSCIRIFRKYSSGLKENSAEAIVTFSDEVSFSSFVQQRQEEARRSFLVKVPNLDFWPTLYEMCSYVGKIKNAFHYVNHNDDQFHFLLVEMSTDVQLHEFLKRTLKINPGSDYHNQFLILNENNVKKSKTKKIVKSSEFSDLSGKKNMKNYENLISVSPAISSKLLIIKELDKSSNLTDFIRNCYNIFKANDIATRKKFLMCRQIEVLCSGFFPNAVAYPFGSSVNGFGVFDCDLDIALLSLTKKNDNTIFFHKDYFKCTPDKVRIHLTIFTELLRQFSTGCTEVFFIKNAKVPIVKYKNMFTNVDCDLSLYNLHGIAMSHILFHIGAIDWRIRAIVIFLKLWAHKVGMIVKSPSPSLSNFSLCLMTLFFFQQIKMLPPFNIFSSNENEIFWTGSDLSAVDSYTKNCLKLKNNKSVGALLKLFFEFYSDFDFKKWGISLSRGEIVNNISGNPLYIENPLNLNVNVSVNVRNNEVLFIQNLMCDVLKILSHENDSSQVQQLFCLNYGRKKKINLEDIL